MRHSVFEAGWTLQKVTLNTTREKSFQNKNLFYTVLDSFKIWILSNNGSLQCRFKHLPGRAPRYWKNYSLSSWPDIFIHSQEVVIKVLSLDVNCHIASLDFTHVFVTKHQELSDTGAEIWKILVTTSAVQYSILYLTFNKVNKHPQTIY